MAALCCYFAEREGFEPSIRLPVCRLSKAVPSASRPPLPQAHERLLNFHSWPRLQRRRRDSNPRRLRATVFKTVALNRSATPPNESEGDMLALRLCQGITEQC